MTIPLDRLYHYLENIAKEIHDDSVLIYRFWPHGSKNINHLVTLFEPKNWEDWMQGPEIYCNDQEPLDWHYYESVKRDCNSLLVQACESQGIYRETKNFRDLKGSIWDKALILHSEQNSKDVELYRQSGFIPVYYWCHAIIARDWFRYAQHTTLKKNSTTKKFLIYNRAWSGTREYRLKFSDLLIEYNLINDCYTWTNVHDPENLTHYDQHKFLNECWRPIHRLENYFSSTMAKSENSADFNLDDYNATEIEVVLETLFSEQKIHLTEKILRPLALGQPFILASSMGVLKYLRSYGFKTFDPIIDETYDTIQDPFLRLTNIVQTMRQISLWDSQQHIENMNKLQEIARHNQKHFFSTNFWNLVTGELKNNLIQGLQELEDTNTSKYYLENRAQICNNPILHALLQNIRTEEEADKVFKKAQSYYLRSLNRT